MRKGQTPPKSEPKMAKHATKPQPEECRNVAYGTPLKTTINDRRNWTTAVAQPSWNKHKNVARRQWMRKGETPPKSEPKTAKHATKPQPEECRNVAYGTPLKTTINDRRNWTTAVAQPSWNKHKNVARRQWMRKGQTPPKSEPKTAKNATKPQPEECRNVAYGTPLKTTK